MTSPEVTASPTRARLAVGIVSAGRVGTAVGAALERAGHIVFGVSAVSDASIGRAQARLPEAEILTPDVIAARAELLILAVPDTELRGLVEGLAATRVVRPGTVVVHTSGANGIAILAPLTAQGARPLALHPAMTFSGKDEDTARLANCCFGVTAADEIGYAIGQALVIEIGAEPVCVAEHNRLLYHAALAHGSNHLVTLVSDAVSALREALAGDELLGQQLVDADPNGVAERVLAPLLTAALDNTLRRGFAALTGPVARGDVAAVESHLEVLNEVDPDLAAGYRAMSLRSAQRAGSTSALINFLEQK